MPNAQSHLRQADHNRDLIAVLDPLDEQFTDWIATAAFYTAVHLIEAWFADLNMHSATHTDRDSWGGKVQEFRNVVWPNYKELEGHSRSVRYDCIKVKADFVRTDILPSLDAIQQEIVTLLKSRHAK